MRFLHYLGLDALKVKQLKLQRKVFCSKEKELTQAEYERMVKAARKAGDEIMALVIETICSTGIRVSELQFITVEAVLNGKTTIRLKGKTRVLMLPHKLCKSCIGTPDVAGTGNSFKFKTRI